MFNSSKNSYENVSPYKCKLCGKEEAAKYFDNKQMVDECLCFNCNFWDEYTYKTDKSVRIDGQHYMVHPDDNTPYAFQGFGGRKFIIKMNDGKIIETCNLWTQGAIPDYFRDKLPDNATFVEWPKPIGHGQGFLG